MFRRRSRFSRRSVRGAPRGGPAPLALLAGVFVLALAAAVFWLAGVADRSVPTPVETRIELPDAIK